MVTVPPSVIGEFDIQVGSHTDNLMEKNLNRWIKNETNFRKRPAYVTQFYDNEIINEKQEL